MRRLAAVARDHECISTLCGQGLGVWGAHRIDTSGRPAYLSTGRRAITFCLPFLFSEDPMFGALARRLFGSANDRYVKSLEPIVSAINELEPQLEAMSDDELRG